MNLYLDIVEARTSYTYTYIQHILCWMICMNILAYVCDIVRILSFESVSDLHLNVNCRFMLFAILSILYLFKGNFFFVLICDTSGNI